MVVSLQGSPALAGELILASVPHPLSCANKKNCSVCLGKEAQSHSWTGVCLHSTLKSPLKRGEKEAEFVVSVEEIRK